MAFLIFGGVSKTFILEAAYEKSKKFEIKQVLKKDQMQLYGIKRFTMPIFQYFKKVSKNFSPSSVLKLFVSNFQEIFRVATSF